MNNFLDLSSKYFLKNEKIFGDSGRFHHLGIIIKEVNSTQYNSLKFIHDPIQKVNVAFYKMHDLVLEIVVPASGNCLLLDALKQKTFYHHICFSVQNIENAINNSSKYGIRRISPISPAVAFSNRSICWCIGKNYGLIELIEI